MTVEFVHLEGVPDAGPSYTWQDCLTLLNFHEEVAQANVLGDRFYKRANAIDKNRHKVQIRVENHKAGRVEFTAGTVGSMNDVLVHAAVVDAQTRAYVREKTMGTNYPVNDAKRNRELVAEMIGMDAHRVIAMINLIRMYDVTPLVGVHGVWGLGELTTEEALTAGSDVKTTLPTTQALRVVGGVRGRDAEERLGQWWRTPESQTINISRLFSNSYQVKELSGDYGRDISKTTALSMMAVAIHGFSVRGYLPQPKLFIYDVNNGKLHNYGQRTFQMEQLADADKLIATPDVMDSILVHHYGPEEQYGGYLGGIIIGGTNFEKFYLRSMENLMKSSLGVREIFSQLLESQNKGWIGF